MEKTVREIKRDGKRFYLNEREVIVFPISKPILLHLYNGYNNEIDFKTVKEIRRELIPLAEDLCDKLKAQGYEIGDNLVTWGSDPGFGSRIEHYAIQFYELEDKLEMEWRRKDGEWWRKRMEKDTWDWWRH